LCSEKLSNAPDAMNAMNPRTPTLDDGGGGIDLVVVDQQLSLSTFNTEYIT